MSIRHLSPELSKIALDDMGETSERLKSAIEAIRFWMEKQPHLMPRNDDQFIVAFIRCCKFSLEETKKRIDAYLTCKTIYSELFGARPVDLKVLDILRCGLISIPPNPLPCNGARLFISHFAQFDTKKHRLRDVFKVHFMLFEILAFEDDNTGVSGLEQVIDLKNCTLQQALHIETADLKKILAYQEQCVPLRLRRVHVINLKPEIHTAYKLARGILPASSSIEVILHEKECDLYNYIPQDSMTAEYGGKNGIKVDITKELVEKFKAHAEYFDNDALLGTNEKLRREPNHNFQTDFGLDGSFRKLEVD